MVGHQCKERALHVKPEAPPAGLLAHDGVDPQALPDLLQNVDVPVGPRADQPPTGIGGEDLLGRAAAQDALGQPAQALGHLGASARPQL